VPGPVGGGVDVGAAHDAHAEMVRAGESVDGLVVLDEHHDEGRR
jgi:hypothetical protein